jgi:hypothetical protein
MGLAWFVILTRRRWLRFWPRLERHYAIALGVLATSAALLSAAYLTWVLRGGPRIIDATAYYQQARVFASGHFTEKLFEVGAATRGRFLYASPATRELGVLFPPGYAALLSLGFRVGAPLVVGPVLAALLVVATAELTRRVFRSRSAALAAAILSTITVVLRYHTADTMSHGLAALLVTVFVVAVLRFGGSTRHRRASERNRGSTIPLGAAAIRGDADPSTASHRQLSTRRSRAAFALSSGLLAGVALGWLIATRPITGAALLVASSCVWLVRIWSTDNSPRRAWNRVRARQLRFVAGFLLGLLPGCSLWFAYQWVTTGSPFHATQMAYYAVADGPAGCFRYGFGEGIGCLFEHGTYVERRLPNGFGLPQALYVTLLRLRWHSLDVLNCEPLVLLAIAAAVDAARRARARLLLIAAVSVIVGYLPFYFDASYPGGGARLYVDIIPLEHALVAGWLMRKRRQGAVWSAVGTVAGARAWQRFVDLRWLVPVSLIGFALHGSFEHLRLRDRDGGRPMFEPSWLAAGGIQRGLIWTDTDHGYLLGHDPKRRDPTRDVVVLRHHGDAHDRAVWEALGRPPAYRYRYDPMAKFALPRLEPVTPAAISAFTRFEAEAEWPALAVADGWVRPVYPPNDCTSGRRGLALEPTLDSAVATLAIHSSISAARTVEFGFVAHATGLQQLHVSVGEARFDIERQALVHQCWTAEIPQVPLMQGEQPMRIETNALGVVVDYWAIR